MTTLYDLLRHEVEHGTQRSAAVLYALCFITKGPMHEGVAAANRAIIDRWSMSGLERVKAMAWKIAEANTTPERIPCNA